MRGAGPQAACWPSPAGAPHTRGRGAAASLGWRGEYLGLGSLGGGRVDPPCTGEVRGGGLWPEAQHGEAEGGSWH